MCKRVEKWQTTGCDNSKHVRTVLKVTVQEVCKLGNGGTKRINPILHFWHVAAHTIWDATFKEPYFQTDHWRAATRLVSDKSDLDCSALRLLPEVTIPAGCEDYGHHNARAKQ